MILTSLIFSLVPSFAMLSVCNRRLKSHSIRNAPMMSVTSGVIIGGGRIGNMLWELNDKKDIMLKRNEKLSSEGNGPIYVCTRNNDLEGVIESTPPSRREDLVFLQNGMLEAYLKSKNLADNTQALIYFAVAKKGDAPIDGKTDVNPEGLTAVTGKWAIDFSERLKVGNLTCKVLDKNEWYIAMLEKHIWICSVMAIGSKYKCTVGEVESQHGMEVRALIAEMASLTEMVKRVKFPDGLADRLCAYSRSVAHFPTALKEVEWRNGWFLEITLNAVNQGYNDPLPLHTELMGSAEGTPLYFAFKAWNAKKKKNSYVIPSSK